MAQFVLTPPKKKKNLKTMQKNEHRKDVFNDLTFELLKTYFLQE